MDIRAFGPAGQAGIDCTPILQAAMDAMVANGAGGLVTLPTGTYNFEGPVYYNGSNLTIAGEAPVATVLNYTGGGALFRNGDTSTIKRRITWRDLSISNGGIGDSGGIRLENAYDCLVERIQFENPGASAGAAVEFVGTGSTFLNTLFKCYFNVTVAGGVGVRWTAGAAHANSERVLDCYINTVNGALALNMADTGCTGNHILSNEINLAGGTPIVIAGNHTSYVANQHDGTASTISVTGNYNRFGENTNAAVITWSDTGTGNVLVAHGNSLGTPLKFADVTMDGATGIAVVNSKLTLANSGAVVIVDGTSDMFKIWASGTLSVAFSTGIGTASATLSPSPSTFASHTAFVSNSNLDTGIRMAKSWETIDSPPVFAAVASGGSPTYKIIDFLDFARVSVTHTAATPSDTVTLSAIDTDNTGTAYATYYLFIETAL